MHDPTLEQARSAYFATSGFDTSSYSDRWVEVRIGRVLLRAPNTPARRALVPCHDLHHALTGYQADLRGEAEIGAWEVASGLRLSATGYYLDLTAMVWGMVIAPRRTWRAFVRGRRSRGQSLYYRADYNTLLSRPLTEAQVSIGLADTSIAPRAADALSFGVALLGAVGALGLTAVTLPGAIALGLLPASPQVPSSPTATKKSSNDVLTEP